MNQAGICILYEAGGAAFGAKTKPLSGQVDADLLGMFSLTLYGETLKSSWTKVPVCQRYQAYRGMSFHSANLGIS
jgi:hypothetical protein